MSYRLAVVASHPIQYHSPWFRHLAGCLDLEVFYAYRQDGRGQSAAGFGVEFDWDVPLLDGYEYRWLKNVAAEPGVSSFYGCDTPEIGATIGSRRYDAVLVLGWGRKSSLQAVLACWRAKVPVLMRGDSHLNTRRSLWRRIAKYPAYRWFLPRLDAHLVVGDANRRYLRHYDVPEERLFFAPHFVDAGHFDCRDGMEAGRAVRRDLGIGAEAFVFLFVGKLIDLKRPLDPAAALARIQARDPGADVHLVYVGDGPRRPELLQTVRGSCGSIHWVGFQNQSRLPSFYAAADALVVPSTEETWGLVVNEAAAAEVPAVVSDGVGCGPDLIDRGVTGYIYPAGDLDALADVMTKIRGRCREAGELVREGLRAKAAHYSIETATGGLTHALEKVVEGADAPAPLNSEVAPELGR